MTNLFLLFRNEMVCYSRDVLQRKSLAQMSKWEPSLPCSMFVCFLGFFNFFLLCIFAEFWRYVENLASHELKNQLPKFLATLVGHCSEFVIENLINFIVDRKKMLLHTVSLRQATKNCKV